MAVETVPFVLTPGPSVWGPRVALPSLGRIRKLLLSPLTHGFRIFHFVLRVGVFSADALVFRGRLFFVRPWRWGRFASFLFRQTPRILVCMPFDALPSERVYQCIIKPMIRLCFGVNCVRISHPVDGDWREALRDHLLRSHVVIFDHSFGRDTVETEWTYLTTIQARTDPTQRGLVRICYRPDGPAGPITTANQDHPDIALTSQSAEEFGGTPVPFTFDDPLVEFAGEFYRRMVHALKAAGFQQGLVDSWVLYPEGSSCRCATKRALG